MISCIICSRHSDIPTVLKENIASTIGCEYEVVIIDNSKNEYSIFSAYNAGVRQSKGDTLCFMHEDITYHTPNWGKEVECYFTKYPQVGLIGVAGTHYLSSLPSGWWETEILSGNLIQGYSENGVYKTRHDYWANSRNNPTMVVAVDGLWMCIPRKMFEEIRWDDINLNGFHGYDVDMSLQIWNIGYEVHIVWDVLLEHRSQGNLEAKFYEIYERLWTKWGNCLPMIKGIEIGGTEQDARTRIVELKAHIRERNMVVEQIYHSHAYRLGKFILRPFSWLRRMLTSKK